MTILAAGTVFTLVAAIVICIVMLTVNTNLFVTISCYIFLGLSALSLISNLTPLNAVSIRNLHNDKPTLANDGKQIVFTLKIKRALPLYWDAQNDIKEQKYQEAANKLKQVLSVTPYTENVVRQLILICIHAKAYEDAEFYSAMLEQKGKLTHLDILNIACVQSSTGKNDEAIVNYQKVLKRDRHNLIALNNLGEEMVRKGAHEVARHLLDRAIAIDPKFEYPYCILAYSNLTQEKHQEAKVLLDKCISLNNANATTYMYLSIYYLKTGDRSKASINIEKALDIDPALDISDHNKELALRSEKVTV